MASALPTQAKETAGAKEETMSSVSQRQVLVGVDDGSLQISQKQQSKVLVKIAHLDLLARPSVENLCVVDGANADQRVTRDRIQVQMGSSRVGRFSVQSTASAGCIENQTERFQPRALVARGLRELSPGGNPVNHSRNKVAPEFSSL